MTTDEQNMGKASIEMKSMAKQIDELIEEAVGVRLGFSLVIHTTPRTSYISNCARDEATEALRELLVHWESEYSDIEAHEFQ